MLPHPLALSPGLEIVLSFMFCLSSLLFFFSHLHSPAPASGAGVQLRSRRIASRFLRDMVPAAYFAEWGSIPDLAGRDHGPGVLPGVGHLPVRNLSPLVNGGSRRGAVRGATTFSHFCKRSNTLYVALPICSLTRSNHSLNNAMKRCSCSIINQCPVLSSTANVARG